MILFIVDYINRACFSADCWLQTFLAVAALQASLRGRQQSPTPAVNRRWIGVAPPSRRRGYEQREPGCDSSAVICSQTLGSIFMKVLTAAIKAYRPENGYGSLVVQLRCYVYGRNTNDM